MQVLKILAKRIAGLVLLLLALSIVTFGLLYLTGSDPARSLVGAKHVSDAQLEAIRNQYHLNDPVWQQYLYWLGNVFKGNLGTSTRTQLSVTSMIASRFGITLALSLMALVLALAVGLPLGITAAKHAGGWQDRLITTLSIAGLSAPSYAIGLLLLYVLSAELKLFPVYGAGDGTLLDTFYHLLLPAITLAIGILASVVKISRAALTNEINSDYTLFARSRGVSRRSITLGQLQNASLPILTSSGLLIASLVSGTVIVETMFSLGGTGTLLQQSVTFGDIPCVQAITLVLAGIICVSTAIVDTAAQAIDPRLRVRGRAVVGGTTVETSHPSDTDNQINAQKGAGEHA